MANDEKKLVKPEKQERKRSGRFFRDIIGEFKRIEWPTKNQVINNTIAVLVMMMFVGVFIWAFDFGISRLFNLIFGR